MTVFPQPIGLAATFNPEALHKAAGMIADEGRAIGPSAPRCQLVRFRRVALEPGERRTLTFRLSTRDLAYVKRLERAIRRGDIVWNGVPYTVESEAMNRALFEGGLALSARLDKRYHRHTVAAKMTDVPDPVFGTEVLGKGCAIWPDDSTVYAPVSGTVTVTMGHAVGLMSDDGIEVLVHVGVDTVNLQGKGFTGLVKKDDKVKAGQPMLQFDKQVIADAGYKDVVVLAVSNTAEFADVAMEVEPETSVAAGTAVVKVTRK